MNLLTHIRKITILRFVLAGLVLLFSVPALFADGIASRYPNDVGIENDPDVLLFDGFENYRTPSELSSQWDILANLSNMQIATEPGDYFAGRKGLEMKLPVSSNEVIDLVGIHLSPQEPQVFVRAYMKWDLGFNVTGGHNGIGISAHSPGGAGVPPPRDGSGWFSFLFQNSKSGTGRGGENLPGYNQVYAYWPSQRTNYGDHWFSDGWVQPGGWGLWILYPFQYPHFVAMPNWQPLRGVWYCFEFMVKANTIGQRNGEVAFWVDGQLKGRFTDLFMRSLDSIKIDKVRIRLHANSNLTRINKKWHDNVVIARSYIGPISRAGPTPTPTPP
jgi:hypothetical protein